MKQTSTGRRGQRVWRGVTATTATVLALSISAGVVVDSFRTDIDKFNSVVKTYGGTGSKALFVTQNPMNDMSQQKCMDHKILTFALDEPHLGMDNDKALARLLDAQLYNINIK